MLTHLPAVSRPAAVDVVKGKELEMRFVAASTPIGAAAVVLNDKPFDLLFALPFALVYLWVCGTPLPIQNEFLLFLSCMAFGVGLYSLPINLLSPLSFFRVVKPPLAQFREARLSVGVIDGALLGASTVHAYVHKALGFTLERDSKGFQFFRLSTLAACSFGYNGLSHGVNLSDRFTKWRGSFGCFQHPCGPFSILAQPAERGAA